MNPAIRPAESSDVPAAHGLLRAASLPTDDLPADLPHFVVLYDQTRLVGLAGMEYHGPVGLLRSVAVSPEYRSQRLGEKLVGAVLDAAREAGVREAYLITTTAEAYFRRYGCATVARTDVPEAIGKTSQFNGLCPSTATVMKMTL